MQPPICNAMYYQGVATLNSRSDGQLLFGLSGEEKIEREREREKEIKGEEEIIRYIPM